MLRAERPRTLPSQVLLVLYTLPCLPSTSHAPQDDYALRVVYALPVVYGGK